MKKAKNTVLLGLFIIPFMLHAGEGMWLPHLLKSLNEGEMREMGMKMSAEDIYSVNQGSLKDAIAHFGGFCTSEIISSKGLLLTNHHCGYSSIQSLSTLENNYLKDGFWAKNGGEELPVEGLFVRFLVKVEDITDKVLKDVKEDLPARERQSAIDKNIAMIKASMDLEPFQEIQIKPIFKGNQYILLLLESYHDVRLVGTPPESIGKFGADTDNWVWPRHTGDFSLFRIYAAPDNSPAFFSEDNVPYTPKHYLPVSMDGIEEGDFTLVFGFPGSTNEYLPSYALENIIEHRNPAKIAVRTKALDIMGKRMRKDEATRLKYASKFARTANYWKKWQGEILGMEKTGAVQAKKRQEVFFESRLDLKDEWKKKYGGLLPAFEKHYGEIVPYAVARDVYGEIFGRNIELFRLCSYAQRLVNAYENGGEKALDQEWDRTYPAMERIYKDYDAELDREIAGELLYQYSSLVDKKFVPESLRKDILFMKGMDAQAIGNFIFSRSNLQDRDAFLKAKEQPADLFIKAIKGDEAYQTYLGARELFTDKIMPHYNVHQQSIDSLMTFYMKSTIEMFPEKTFYPDANSTMRVSYGKVEGYSPADAVHYGFVTNSDGVLEKYVPGDYEFDLPEKLKDLFMNKDFGPYADDSGKLPICFIGSNHTTGGNSGSPAIDAEGNLIGLNFDRVWEGTMSDYYYDVSICRNIMVDVRYILFVIDKFGGASYLIDEMTLVYPKSGD
jgi:hypothetical protein